MICSCLVSVNCATPAAVFVPIYLPPVWDLRVKAHIVVSCCWWYQCGSCCLWDFQNDFTGDPQQLDVTQDFAGRVPIVSFFSYVSDSASKNLQEAWYTSAPKLDVNTIDTMAVFIETSFQTSSWTQSILTILTFCNWSPDLLGWGPLQILAVSMADGAWLQSFKGWRDRNSVWKTARPLTSHFWGRASTGLQMARCPDLLDFGYRVHGGSWKMCVLLMEYWMCPYSNFNRGDYE